MTAALHIPVLLRETLDALAVKKGGRYIDGTFGRGGHARAIAERGGEVLGIDRDDEAVASAGGIKVVKGRHGDIAAIAAANGWNEVDGILLDLGVSSPQLDGAERGFSFMREGPLDMRMDRSCGATAADIVRDESAEGLERIFREYGEEPNARRLARAIAAERDRTGGAAFETTSALAEFIVATIGRRGAKHPATRVFQALRMAVNDETGELSRALESGAKLLAHGGRFAVITFESVTDRIVKRFFAAHAGRVESLQQGGAEWRGEEPRMRPVTRRALRPRAAETDSNPRARSAKLRASERE